MSNTPRVAAVLATVAASFALTATLSHAGTITAHATAASTSPGLVPGTSALDNGDFHIDANPLAPATGDGVDEWTHWAFDFTSDPGYAAFMAGGSLVSAKLTLHLSTGFFSGGLAPVTDVTRPNDDVSGLFPQWILPGFITPSPLGGYAQGTISTDLVANVGEDPAALFKWLKDHTGKFPMIYGDDALVTGATLELASTVPEPETYAMFLAGLGLMGTVARRRKAA